MFALHWHDGWMDRLGLLPDTTPGPTEQAIVIKPTDTFPAAKTSPPTSTLESTVTPLPTPTSAPTLITGRTLIDYINNVGEEDGARV